MESMRKENEMKDKIVDFAAENTAAEERLLEKEVKSQEIYKGRLLHVFCDTIELPDGQQATREYIKHLGAVCIVAVTDTGNVIMERQYRYPVGRVLCEIPAGKLDRPDEDRLEAAKRELKEETGLTADRWQDIGRYLPAPAYSGEDITMFLATGLHQGERHLDDEEFLEVYEVPMEELVEDIVAGRIADAKTQAAVLKAYLILKARS